MLEASNQEGAAAAPPRRRVTADSFRALQARLAGVPFVPRDEPVMADSVPAVAGPFHGEAAIAIEPAPPVFTAPVDWMAPPATPETPLPIWQAEAVEDDKPATNGHPVEITIAAAPEPEPEPEPPEAEHRPPVDTPEPPAWAFEPAMAADDNDALLADVAEPEPDYGIPETSTPVWTPVEEASPVAEVEPLAIDGPAGAPLDAMEEARQVFAQIATEAEPPTEVSELSAPAPAVEAPASAAPRRQSIIRRGQPTDDPFAGASTFNGTAEAPAVAVVVEEPDIQAGEVARSLIDIMASTAGSSQPQERALAADTLLRLVPRVPARELVQIADRVAKMDNPPQLLVSRIIRDPRPEVAAALLERASNIVDQELLAVAAENDPMKLRMIARRRTVSTAISDAIIKSGDASALLTLVRNPGASLSHDAFQTLCEMARHTPALHAPLATRADTPPVVAFQMFWLLPAELRRYILSRFLTDSETLNRILKITMAVDGGEDAIDAGETKFANAEDIDTFLDLAATGDIDGAAWHLSEIGGICEETGRRILGDAEGEPLAVLLKSLGLNRTRFGEALERLSQAPATLLRAGRNLTDLQGIFDQLSFNKARVLLTYWDWAAQQTGPYAKRAA